MCGWELPLWNWEACAHPTCAGTERVLPAAVWGDAGEMWMDAWVGYWEGLKGAEAGLRGFQQGLAQLRVPSCTSSTRQLSALSPESMGLGVPSVLHSFDQEEQTHSFQGAVHMRGTH